MGLVTKVNITKFSTIGLCLSYSQPLAHHFVTDRIVGNYRGFRKGKRVGEQQRRRERERGGGKRQGGY